MASSEFELREPPKPPSIDELAESHSISILHPGYPDDKNCLFLFNACDHPQGGLHKVVVLTACGIIAGNVWDGYLCTTRDGTPVDEAIQVLREPVYYFYAHPYPHSPATSSAIAGADIQQNTARQGSSAAITPAPSFQPHPPPYPVYTSFRAWPFPHRRMPPWWPTIRRARQPIASHPQSRLTEAVRQRDVTCRLTGWGQITEAAHIVPREESDWFGDNNMKVYSPSTLLSTTDNAANVFLLRRDVHYAYDRSIWTVVPKKPDAVSTEAPWVFHLLDSDEEYKAAYHNVKLRDLGGVRSEYLLAGFALVIFPMLTSFLGNSINKALVGKSICSDPRGRVFNGEECGKTFPSNKDRNRSPKKHKGGDEDEDEEARREGNGRHGDSGSSDKLDISRQRARKRPKFKSSASLEQYHPKPAEGTDTQPRKVAKTAAALSSKLSEPIDTQPPCQCPSPTYEPPTYPVDEDPAKTEEPEAEVIGDVCYARDCRTWKDLERLGFLRQQALEKERARSHVSDWWHRQVEWAREGQNRTYAGKDLEQLMWVQGEEIFDQQTGDHFESTEQFLQLIGPWTTATASTRGV